MFNFKNKGGEKVKKFVFLILPILIAAFSVAPAIAGCMPPVEISKEPYCNQDPGDVLWSDNPPYYVGMKYYWWIKITVTANTDLEDVVVYDRLGAELMIEGICLLTPKEDPYDYKFTYTPYGRDGDVAVTGLDSASGKLNKDGIAFGSEPFEFHIFWTGNSVKVHFQWNIGDIPAGTSGSIFLVVSTDKNPAGHQEYTSCGCYEMNSGATIKAIVASTGKRVSAESASIMIEVVCD